MKLSLINYPLFLLFSPSTYLYAFIPRQERRQHGMRRFSCLDPCIRSGPRPPHISLRKTRCEMRTSVQRRRRLPPPLRLNRWKRNRRRTAASPPLWSRRLGNPPWRHHRWESIVAQTPFRRSGIDIRK